MAETIVIVGAKRTPIGSMQGKFGSVTASQLGSVAIKAAIEQAGVKPDEVDDLIFRSFGGGATRRWAKWILRQAPTLERARWKPPSRTISSLTS